MEKSIDYAIVFNDYMKNNLIRSGFHSDKIFVKPHFTHNDDSLISKNKNSNYFLFLGAVSRHKGIFTLVNAFKIMKHKIILKIAGNGDSIEILKEYIKEKRINNIEILGEIRDDNKKMSLISNSIALIIPSESPETFCLSVIESFGQGVPVISSEIGSLKYLIKNNYNGYKFKTGSHTNLLEKINLIMKNKNHDKNLSSNAKKDYDKIYSPLRNQEFFEQIFKLKKTRALN